MAGKSIQKGRKENPRSHEACRIHHLLRDTSKPRLSRSPFEYEALRTKDDTIRLLVLWPFENEQDELDCSLIEAVPTSMTSYFHLESAIGERGSQRISISTSSLTFQISELRRTSRHASRSQVVVKSCLWTEVPLLNPGST